MKQRLFHLHALSALHIGTGQSAGTVDLPIARARATNLPLVPGSAIKGVLRDELPDLDTNRRKTLFGPDNIGAGDAHAGALAVGDAHLLILPVRSFAGVVAFATCPFILNRYARDFDQAPLVPAPAEKGATVTSTSALKTDGHIALEDLELAAQEDASTDAWAGRIAASLYPDSEIWRGEFTRRFAVLADDVFSFLADTATEIRARIRIDNDTRTVDTSALWYEENLPAESVLWGVIGVSRARDQSGLTAQQLSDSLPARELALQIGGKHTVGRGLCRFLLA
ncbi:MAG: type III-B CRISPR module RAMP protein Cmr4 [Rhodocyclaceae bacterium]|nr:type III-B CRISPR module RAMP protein Cmr4 [Rhodocyclaceae bacterium]